MQNENLGFAGKLAAAFTHSKLTPLAIVSSLLVGFLSVLWTPREEEPQILVPMVDVMIPFQGASPKEVEERIVTPVEKLLWGISDVEYIYSVAQPERALMTVRFRVGTELEPAVVRIHHKLRENMPDKPEGIGVPLVRSYTIDDVPFLALVLYGRDLDDSLLRRDALHLSKELSDVSDISRIQVIGGETRQVRILPDPKKLQGRNLTLLEFFGPLQSANVEGRVGNLKNDQREIAVEVDGFFTSAEKVSEIVIGIKGGRAVRVKDVAQVVDGPAERSNFVRFVEDTQEYPAVTMAFSKRPGANATELSKKILEKIERVKGGILEKNVQISVSRDYGRSAEEKSNTLIEHLLIATFSVMILIAFVLGLSSSWVVGAAVPVTLALTLMIYYLWGYSLNRVTLFALIFSIGILVDDAIVVVENIHRHLHDPKLRGNRSLYQIIVRAVDEVGNPTILATFTVIAAILPMAFVSGLMGPYMRPIPLGASMAMLFSLIVAFTVSPWAAAHTHQKFFVKSMHEPRSEPKKSLLDRFYDSFMGALLDRSWARWSFVLVVLLMFVGIGWMIYGKAVRVKMLPFDNKSEFQIMVDLDEGVKIETTLEATRRIGEAIHDLPELDSYQIYAGNSAPITFNGLVRHYFLRSGAYQADLQVNLVPKKDRSRQSHEIAKDVRNQIQNVAHSVGAKVKVVEIPPGPPVLSTLVAEVYGPSHEGQMDLARKVESIFREAEGVVDIDSSIRTLPKSIHFEIEREKASLKRLPADRILHTLQTALHGGVLGILHDEMHPEPIPIVLQLPLQSRARPEVLENLTVMTDDFSFVQLKDVTSRKEAQMDEEIHHKNLQRVVYVLGDVAGKEESPVYAIMDMTPKIEALGENQKPLPIHTARQPESTDQYSLKWDGEWHITYEVFRDLGLAFAIVLILIYVLVVGWFQSFLVPLIIMIPIPLSLIGIIPGHWIFGAFFTATSMIGFIAGAGIIVRNSIILVDFIELGLKEGKGLREAVLEAGEVRFRPMLLTAAAVVVGSAVILFDPIFQGLAISLMMGEVAATLLSRFAVPLLYFVVAGKSRQRVLYGRKEDL